VWITHLQYAVRKDLSPSPPLPPPSQSGCAVYVAGFDDEVSNEDFEAAFGGYGEIAQVSIRGKDKKFAFVTFATPEAASSAVGGGASLNGSACTVELQVRINRHLINSRLML
jgi:RNA recognition motif-containing protein